MTRLLFLTGKISVLGWQAGPVCEGRSIKLYGIQGHRQFQAFTKSVLPIFRHGNKCLIVELATEAPHWWNDYWECHPRGAPSISVHNPLWYSQPQVSSHWRDTRRVHSCKYTNVQPWFWGSVNHKGYQSLLSTSYSLVLGRERYEHVTYILLFQINYEVG